MAQKTTSNRNGAKKGAVKGRKAIVRARASGTKGVKAKPKAAPAKAASRHLAKPAPVTAKSGKNKPATPAAAKPQPRPAAVVKAVGKPAGSTPKIMLPKDVAIKQAIAAAARSGQAGTARTMPAAVAKLAGQKITGPASAPGGKVAPAPVDPKKKPVNQRHGFKTNEWIVYPAHGVGRIVTIEEQEIAGISLELFVITFEKDKMTLRVPTGKSQSVGMRKLAEEGTVKKAMETLKGRARVKRTMWSRRAQEYEAKINSGDLISIAEVVRDLYRSESQPEQSYSERQLYEAALDRMAREIAAVEKLDERGAVQRITEVLAKSARGRRLAAEEAESKAA
jgi:CarD family transcriptional regulator